MSLPGSRSSACSSREELLDLLLRIRASTLLFSWILCTEAQRWVIDSEWLAVDEKKLFEPDLFADWQNQGSLWPHVESSCFCLCSS